MRLNTLEKLYKCIMDEQPEVTMSEEIISGARKPIEAMMRAS